MSIAFESQESELQKLRERLCKMSVEELVRFGARAEWRRRHPKHRCSAENP